MCDLGINIQTGEEVAVKLVKTTALICSFFIQILLILGGIYIFSADKGFNFEYWILTVAVFHFISDSYM